MTKSQEAKRPARYRSAATLLRATPVLFTESQVDFERIADAFEQEIKPRGIVEQMYVVDMAHFTWEILRLRRCKAGIIHANLHAVIAEAIGQRAKSEANNMPALVKAIEEGSYQPEKDGRIDPPDTIKPVFLSGVDIESTLQTINVLGLDAAVIEADAVRRSISDLGQLERLLASIEARRDKALFRIAEYRTGLAQILRESSDRIIDGEVIALERTSGRKRSAA